MNLDKTGLPGVFEEQGSEELCPNTAPLDHLFSGSASKQMFIERGRW